MVIDIMLSRWYKGNDTLAGGAGNDSLSGGYGSDTYLFNKGDGVDTISEIAMNDRYRRYDSSASDTIKFGEGIETSDLNFAYDGNDVHVTFKGSDTDKLILKNFQGSTLDKFEFANGSVLSKSDIKIGTAGDDNLVGNTSDNIITGNEGDDVITGGQGDDVLAGGAGSDTYNYSSGDGNDTINLAGDGSTDILKLNDISKDDILFSRSDNDLQINFHDQLSSLIIDDYFESQFNNDSLIIDTNDEFQMQLAANANKMAEILAANTSSDDDIDGGSVDGSNQVTTQVDTSQLADLWVPKNNESA